MIPAVTTDPEVQGGTPCFAGTRTPVKSLFDALARGRTVDYFIKEFPSVRRKQVDDVLREAAELVSKSVAPAAA